MKTAFLLLAALLFLNVPLASAAEKADADPAQTVKSFYDFHFKHGMGFGPAEMKARKAWLTPQLYALITTVLKKPVPKGDAPDIEGDIFTDSQDTPTGFHVGKATLDKGTAKVEVSLNWSHEKRQITVILAQVEHAWLIQDIEYGDHRLMTTDLRQAAR